MGSAGYYRRFLEGFSSISSPLTKLTQKKEMFQWSQDCEKSFQELKDRLLKLMFLLYQKVQMVLLLIVTLHELAWDVF